MPRGGWGRRLLLALLVVVPVLASEDPSPAPAATDPLLARIAATAAATTTSSGSFTERTVRPGDPAPTVIQGTFAVAPPDRYDVVETKPSDPGWCQRWCSDGTWQWDIETTFAGVEPTVTKKPATANAGDLRRITDCLRGDLRTLEEDYALHATPVAGGTDIRLQPLPGHQTDLSDGTIHCDAHDRIQGFDLLQPSGTRIALTITAATYNQPIDPARFSGPP